MELLILLLAGYAIYAAFAAPIKRSKHKSKCPNCGTECNASPWGAGIQFEAKYKCPKCGNVFYRKYSKL